MGKSVFEKIADRELPGYIVWENESHIAFLTIEPLEVGHTLVVPKKNLGDELFALGESEYLELWRVSREVAGILKEKLECDRVLVIVEGFEVPHVHVHLVPAHKGQTLAKMSPNHVEKEQLEEVRKRIVGE